MNKFYISKRVKSVIRSPIRKFIPLTVKAEADGIKVWKLNIGDPDLTTPDIFFRALKFFPNKTLGYSPSSGLPEHINAWIKYYRSYGVKLQPEQIVATIGASEAMLMVFLAATDPGDEVLAFEPLYTNYKAYAAVCGIKLLPVTLRLKNNFALPDKAELLKKITAETRAVLIINPDNPTGRVWKKEELGEIVEIAARNKLHIISDETYREIVYDRKPVSLLQFPKARPLTIIIDSISKRFSCPGARIGCIVSMDKELIRQVSKLAMARLSPPTLEQFASIPLLEDHKKFTKTVASEYKKRRNLVIGALKKIKGVKFNSPQGAFYLVMKLPIRNAEDFVKFLLKDFRYKKQTVSIAPMRDFYLTPGLGKDEIRIAYVIGGKDLKKAMKVFRLGLEAYLKK